MKTIIVTAFHSFISKNILNTNSFKKLLDNKNLRIILLVPKNKKDFFYNIYGNKGVIVEGFDRELVFDKNEKFFDRLSKLLINSHYLYYKKIEDLEKNKNFFGIIKYFLFLIFSKIFGNKKIFANFFRNLYLKFSNYNYTNKVFDKYNPSLLFSTDILDEIDAVFLRTGKVNGIRILGMVRSWDNCYSKGLIKVVPDIILTNNETIAEEIRNVQHMKNVDIEVVGLPQFDHFINDTKKNKKEFGKEIGADLISNRLIVFAPAGNILSDTDWQICKILEEAINNKKIMQNIFILVRNHPHHPADMSYFENNKNFLIETPGKSFDGSNPKEAELTNDASKHLSDTLYNADLVIWVATTLGIDAVVYDKPQIAINFDGFEKKDYYHSVKKYHDEDHMKKMLDLGGVTAVNNPEELIFWINKYLEDSSINRDKRKLMIDQQLWKLDGKSGERIGNFILNEIERLN